MSKFLIIPARDNITESLALSKKYDLGFEYNDFFIPDVMDNPELTEEIIGGYKSYRLPEYCTMHGAFFDVTIFSSDKKIRAVSEERIYTSLDIARKIGAKGVVFHTNHNPSLTAKSYVENWLDCNEEFFRKALSEYPELNIYMENMFDTSPDMLTTLAKRLSDMKNFGICFDYAHAVIYGSDIDGWVKSVAPFVKHMHINDNDLVNDLHLAVGDGKIDWNKFKSHFENELSEAESVLIETSSIENQKRSAEFLANLGLI